MRPGLLLGLYITLLSITTLTTAVLGAITLGAVPSSMEYVLQNWAWVKTKALPFTEPLGTANATANNMSRLSIVLIALAVNKSLSLLNVLMLLSRRGALALVPGAAHLTSFGLAAVIILCGFSMGTTACFALPLGCTGAKLLLLSGLLLAVLPFARMLLGHTRDPIGAPLRFAAYMAYLFGTLCLFIASAAILGDAAEQASGSVLDNWGSINLALPTDTYLCTGHRQNVFRSAADTTFSELTSLASAAIFVVLCLMLLAMYTRYASWEQLTGDFSSTGGGANRVVDQRVTELRRGMSTPAAIASSSSEGGGAWWFSSTTSFSAKAEPLMGVEDAEQPSLRSYGRADTAPAGPGIRFDAIDRYQYDGVRSRAAAEGTSSDGGAPPLTTRRSSMLTNIDNDGLAQAVMHDAGLFPQWLEGGVPRLACSARVLLAAVAVVVAYVAGMIFFDMVGAAGIPYEGSSRQTKSLSIPFALDYSIDSSGFNFNVASTLLNVRNGFSHGSTNIVLSSGNQAVVEVYLTVDTPSPLDDEVSLTNATCTDSPEPTFWTPNTPCHTPEYVQCKAGSGEACKTAQLNITAQPPESCNEDCGWAWLWFPCRCHTAANLTIVLPSSAVNGNISEILAPPYAMPLVLTDPHLFQQAFIDINVESTKGGAVVVEPSHDDAPDLDPSDIKSLLGRFAANNLRIDAKGEVRLTEVLATGMINVTSETAAVLLDDVFSGQAVHAVGASLSATDAFVSQPCFYIANPLIGKWVGGPACASMGKPIGDRPNVTQNEVAAPFGLVLGPFALTASGDFDGAILINGTVIASSAPLATPKGIVALSGARFVGSLEMSFTDESARGSNAYMNNVAVLDCSVCKPTELVEYLGWDDLPLSQDVPTIFCACEPADVHGILLDAGTADFKALLAIASNVTATSTHGELTLDEFVLTSGTPTTTLNGTIVGPLPPFPSINMSSTYGAVTLNGLIASGAGVTYNVSLSSMAGDVKGLFNGGALDGEYQVETAEGGIGHVGVCINNEITHAAAGHVGQEGNASVYIYHNYGDVSLFMSSSSPSVFDGITGSFQASGSGSLFGATAPGPASAEGIPEEPGCVEATTARPVSSGVFERVPLARRVVPMLEAIGAQLLQV